MMFHRGDKDFVTRFDVRIAPTAGNEIDASRSSGCEYDFERFFGADESADFFAGVFVLLGAAFAERVDAAVDVGIIPFVHAAEDIDHLPRSLGAGSVIEE